MNFVPPITVRSRTLARCRTCGAEAQVALAPCSYCAALVEPALVLRPRVRQSPAPRIRRR